MHARRLRAAGGCRGFVSWPGRKAPERAIAFDPIAVSNGWMLIGRILAKVFRAYRTGEARSGGGNMRCEATKSFCRRAFRPDAFVSARIEPASPLSERLRA
jgi:hypothetical protein